jgi:hypothetical protein
MPNLGDRVATGFSRAVTRRSMLKRSMAALAATGAAVAAPIQFSERRAGAAGTCAYYQNRFGTTCASSIPCGSSRCTSDGGCDLDSARKRCDVWPVAEDNGNYCWCSSGNCYLGVYAWYLCCDCWVGGYNNGLPCSSSGGQTRCNCRTPITFGAPC